MNWRNELRNALAKGRIINRTDGKTFVFEDLSDRILREDLERFLSEISILTEEEKDQRRQQLERRLANDNWNAATDIIIEAMIENSKIEGETK